MSDQPNAIPESIEETLRTRFDGRSVDWFLQQLVTLVNVGDVEFGITLNVEGSIISGILIGGKKYFTLFSEQFVEGWSEDENKQFWKSHFADFGEKFVSIGETASPPPNYLYLRDARVHTPAGTVPTSTGVLWRGRVNAVSGFSLGKLEQQQS